MRKSGNPAATDAPAPNMTTHFAPSRSSSAMPSRSRVGGRSEPGVRVYERTGAAPPARQHRSASAHADRACRRAVAICWTVSSAARGDAAAACPHFGQALRVRVIVQITGASRLRSVDSYRSSERAPPRRLTRRQRLTRQASKTGLDKARAWTAAALRARIHARSCDASTCRLRWLARRARVVAAVCRPAAAASRCHRGGAKAISH